MSIHTVIEKIRKRPALYLGSESITALFHFLNGYHVAEVDYKTAEESVTNLLPLDFGFMHEFVDFRLGCKNSKGWCGNILEACGGNEKEALSKFFEMYSEFSAAEIKRYWKAVLTKDNIEYNNSMSHGYALKNGIKEPIYRDPKAVYVAELSFGAFMPAVETEDRLNPYGEFFDTAERAMGSRGAETCFGDISQWEEFSGGDISLEKLGNNCKHYEYYFKKITPCEFDKLKGLFDVRTPDDEKMWEKYRSIRLRQFEDKDTDIYVIVCGESFVGELSANYSPHALPFEAIPNIRAYLSTFRLEKEHRGRGLGQKLVEFALDDLKVRGYSEFTIGVEDDNEIAKHIYFKFGFTEPIDRGHGGEFDPCEYTLYLKNP